MAFKNVLTSYSQSIAPTFIVRDHQPNLAMKQIILLDQVNGSDIEVKVERNEETGVVTYVNLPDDLDIMINNFNQQE